MGHETCVLFASISFGFLKNDGHFDHWSMENLKSNFSEFWGKVSEKRYEKSITFWQNADSFNQV